MIEKETITVNVEVKNIPYGFFSEDREGYMVVRQDITSGRPQLWYYGFYEDKERAERAAVECGNGVVLEI